MILIQVLFTFLSLPFISTSILPPSCDHKHDVLPLSQQALHLHDLASPNDIDLLPDPIPLKTREYWMRAARSALLQITGSPCPFGAFGTAIVNHTAQDPGSLGTLVCIGANSVATTGNPTLHGETAGINNCTSILRSAYGLSPDETLAAFADLTLYTTAEPCPMCATAIGWAGFKEYVFATSVWRVIELGWSQPRIGSREVLEWGPMAGLIRTVGGVLKEEMDELFAWQYTGGKGACPEGCMRDVEHGCVKSET